MANLKRASGRDDLCAVFVHAGAGFHNLDNESKHLLACKQYVMSENDKLEMQVNILT